MRRISIRQIIQHRIKQNKRPDREKRRPNNRHDPMHVLSRRPPEPEQRDGDAEAAHAGGEEALLGGDVAGGVEAGLEAIAQVDEEGGDDGEGAGEEAEVGEAFGAEGEVVDVYEDYDEAGIRSESAEILQLERGEAG